jgi:hypothetical protein
MPLLSLLTALCILFSENFLERAKTSALLEANRPLELYRITVAPTGGVRCILVSTGVATTATSTAPSFGGMVVGVIDLY